MVGTSLSRASWAVVLAIVGLVAVVAVDWFFLGGGDDDVVEPGARPEGSARRVSGPTTPPRPALPGDAADDGPRYAPFDCAQPVGDAARVDGVGIRIADLCAHARRLGAVTPDGTDRRQARHVLDRMIDALLVDRALERERIVVTDADLTAALGKLPPRIGADVDLLKEQLRERVALDKLVAKRHDIPAVTEQDVDAELAAGAPGVARGEGVRVEGWIARVPTGGDDDDARERAQRFAAAAAKAPDPAALAARHRLTVLPAFAVRETGVEPELEEAAFALPRDRWSAALRTRVGWAVIRVVGTEPGERLDGAALRVRVRTALENRGRQAARQRVLEALRAAAEIERLVEL